MNYQFRPRCHHDPFFSDCTPESIFSSRAEHQVDIQRKVQEDPLILIKRQEIDSRRKILDNPIKMKQLKKYVSSVSSLLKINKELIDIPGLAQEISDLLA